MGDKGVLYPGIKGLLGTIIVVDVDAEIFSNGMFPTPTVLGSLTHPHLQVLLIYALGRLFHELDICAV